MLFHDRAEAGRMLGERLSAYAGQDDVIVLGLPRGGVPVAFEVARALDVPLDIFLVRKIGVPGHEELAMGAIATGGVCVLNDEVVRALAIPGGVVAAAADRERCELARRERLYRGQIAASQVRGRVAILVDDGLATGSTMRAAVLAVRRLRPKRIVVAVPVGEPTTCDELTDEADETICARTPDRFGAVGIWYGDFEQTTDQEVTDLLARAERQREASSDGGAANHEVVAAKASD